MKTIQCLFISVMVININQYVLLFCQSREWLGLYWLFFNGRIVFFADGSMMNLKDFFNLFPVNLVMHIHWWFIWFSLHLFGALFYQVFDMCWSNCCFIYFWPCYLCWISFVIESMGRVNISCINCLFFGTIIFFCNIKVYNVLWENFQKMIITVVAFWLIESVHDVIDWVNKEYSFHFYMRTWR